MGSRWRRLRRGKRAGSVSSGGVPLIAAPKLRVFASGSNGFKPRQLVRAALDCRTSAGASRPFRDRPPGAPARLSLRVAETVLHLYRLGLAKRWYSKLVAPD